MVKLLWQGQVCTLQRERAKGSEGSEGLTCVARLSAACSASGRADEPHTALLASAPPAHAPPAVPGFSQKLNRQHRVAALSTLSHMFDRQLLTYKIN